MACKFATEMTNFVCTYTRLYAKAGAIVFNVIPEIALAIIGNPYRSLHML
jgi:hypothetical protein